MQYDRERSIPFLRIILFLFFTMVILLGGAFWLGRRLAEHHTAVEPEALSAPAEPDAMPAKDAVADPTGPIPQPETPEKTSEAPGKPQFPPLTEERRQSLSGSKIGWGQGVEVNEKNQPTGALIGQEKYGDLGAWFLYPTEEKTVYLTFDLGYENGYTAAILDALKEKDVTGTFFITMDYAKSAPELVQRIIDEGHILGNHTVHHPSMPDCSAEKATAEVMELHDYVKEQFGYEMTLFRFPMGEFSEKSLVLLRDLGYTSVFWSYAYVDWNVDSQPDVAASLQKLTRAAHPGAIYLQHTVSATNAALMGDFIDNLHTEGYAIGVLPH